MTLSQAIEILRAYQKWRRGEPPYEVGGPTPFSPSKISEAIDVALKALDTRNDGR